MIGFLTPWALAALPLGALPLLLHLIQRRDPPSVEFPAVRYLVQVTQEHNRRLKLKHWLLLAIRTLLILALVIAAAGPSAPLSEAVSHTPSALVLVLDNSPSSSAVVQGTRRLTDLKAAARRVLARGSPADALWLLTSDGVARRGTPDGLLRALDSVEASDRRMDLGEFLVLSERVLATDQRPGGIVVLSDAQASAMSAATIEVPVVLARSAGEPPGNQGISRIDAGPQPWTPEGGAATVTITGDSGAAAPVTVVLATRPPRQALIPAGGTGSFTLGPAMPGWQVVQASKAADEFRADDDRVALLRVAPVAAASWDPADRYLAAAADVLLASGRVRRGSDLSLGALGRGASVVLPPEDPAQLGALNRALERRGVPWRYGAAARAPALSDSNAIVGRIPVTRRHVLEPVPAGRAEGVVATVGGEPWIVRGGEVVLVGSRFDPSWTALPLMAEFLPLVDVLLNRIARGEVVLLDGAPGDAILIPDLATDILTGEQRWTVEGGAAFRPPVAGLYFVIAGTDTIGGLSVNLDPRESRLVPAEAGVLRSLWPGVRVVSLDDAAGAAFAGAGQASLQGPLLWLALLLGLAEVGLASGLRRLA